MAHRGGASEAPENTLPAFQRAVDLGYRYLETDVHVTADGVVVAFHDNDLKRTTGRDGRISELTWDEISTALVDGREPIPKLTDLLEAWPDARFNIDCKEPSAADPLADVLVAADALHRVCVGSFNDRTVRRLRERLGPQLCTSAGRLDIVLLRLLGWARSPFDAAQVPSKASFFPVVNKRFVRRAHRRGVEVHVWTIDDADEMERLLDLGVDGIMTDRPAVLREVLERRGQWTLTIARTDPASRTSRPAHRHRRTGADPHDPCRRGGEHRDTDRPRVGGGEEPDDPADPRPPPRRRRRQRSPATASPATSAAPWPPGRQERTRGGRRGGRGRSCSVRRRRCEPTSAASRRSSRRRPPSSGPPRDSPPARHEAGALDAEPSRAGPRASVGSDAAQRPRRLRASPARRRRHGGPGRHASGDVDVRSWRQRRRRGDRRQRGDRRDRTPPVRDGRRPVRPRAHARRRGRRARRQRPRRAGCRRRGDARRGADRDADAPRHPHGDGPRVRRRVDAPARALRHASSWPRSSAPAIRLAASGFPASPLLVASLGLLDDDARPRFHELVEQATAVGAQGPPSGCGADPARHRRRWARGVLRRGVRGGPARARWWALRRGRPGARARRLGRPARRHRRSASTS